MKIISATWGYKVVFIDVKKILMAHIKHGNLKVSITPATLGDPCPGWIKELNVVYEHGSKRYVILVQEQPPSSRGKRTLSIIDGKASTNTKHSGFLLIEGFI